MDIWNLAGSDKTYIAADLILCYHKCWILLCRWSQLHKQILIQVWLIEQFPHYNGRFIHRGVTLNRLRDSGRSGTRVQISANISSIQASIKCDQHSSVSSVQYQYTQISRFNSFKLFMAAVASHSPGMRSKIFLNTNELLQTYYYSSVLFFA